MNSKSTFIFPRRIHFQSDFTAPFEHGRLVVRLNPSTGSFDHFVHAIHATWLNLKIPHTPQYSRLTYLIDMYLSTLFFKSNAKCIRFIFISNCRRPIIGLRYEFFFFPFNILYKWNFYQFHLSYRTNNYI